MSVENFDAQQTMRRREKNALSENAMMGEGGQKDKSAIVCMRVCVYAGENESEQATKSALLQRWCSGVGEETAKVQSPFPIFFVFIPVTLISNASRLYVKQKGFQEGSPKLRRMEKSRRTT